MSLSGPMKDNKKRTADVATIIPTIVLSKNRKKIEGFCIF